jgi:ABC-type lipoprotein export system ATPase subunit
VRIRGIEVENFLSFDKFKWDEVDDDLNIIVGPNGAGKTNLFQAIRAVVDVLSPDYSAQQGRAQLRKAVHRADPETVLHIALDVTFNLAEEEQLLRTFLATALSEEGGYNIPGDSGGVRLAAFWYESLPHLDVSFLLAGRLVITCDPLGTWSSRYESTAADLAFRWDLEGSSGNIFSAPPATNDVQGSFLALQSSYGEHEGGLLQQYVMGASERPPAPDMRRVLNGRGIHLEIHGRGSDPRRTHRELARLADLDHLRHDRTYTGSFIFHKMMQRAMVFTDNVRRAPQYEVTTEQLKAPIVDLTSGEQLPLYLMQKLTRSEEREQYRAIQETFRQLTGTGFDIGIIPDQENANQEKKAELLLDLSIDTRWGRLPLEYSGAGRNEALFLSALLASSEGKILLLDEPAQNLHPSVQTSLVNKIRSTNANQVFLVTHSPTLILADAIDKVSRFYISENATRRGSLQLHHKSQKEKGALLKELRGSSDVRALLFARSVILVEGDTEFGVLPIWYRKFCDRYLENDDVILFCVGGDQNFKTYVRLLQDYQIPWAIVCDGAVIGDPAEADERRQRCGIARQVMDADVNRVCDLDNESFQTRRIQLEQYGVFTVAQSAEKDHEGFEESIMLEEDRILLKEKINLMLDDSKVRKARRIAEDNTCPVEVAELLRKVTAYLGVVCDIEVAPTS